MKFKMSEVLGILDEVLFEVTLEKFSLDDVNLLNLNK